MQGIINYFWQFAPGVSPHYLGRSRRFSNRTIDRFENCLQELTQLLGDPRQVEAAMWFPNGMPVACWRRNHKTLSLILERGIRHQGRVSSFGALRMTK